VFAAGEAAARAVAAAFWAQRARRLLQEALDAGLESAREFTEALAPVPFDGVSDGSLFEGFEVCLKEWIPGTRGVKQLLRGDGDLMTDHREFMAIADKRHPTLLVALTDNGCR
jgi:hypothetical protein